MPRSGAGADRYFVPGSITFVLSVVTRPTKSVADAVSVTVIFLVGGSLARAAFRALGSLTLKSVSDPGWTVLVLPLSLIFLPLTAASGGAQCRDPGRVSSSSSSQA